MTKATPSEWLSHLSSESLPYCIDYVIFLPELMEDGMADIIQLKNYRTLVKGGNGVKFPQLYRLRGFYWDTVSFESGTPWASQNPSPVMYTLDEADNGGFANTAVEAIKGFDPAIDIGGWLIIRHHMTELQADGYLDAMCDSRPGEALHTPHTMFETESGIFSLQHCTPPRDATDHLVAYVTKVQSQNPYVLRFGHGWVDDYQIILPDGSCTSDPDLLCDTEDED